jgi:S1-C subfamily serine protease
MVNRLADGVNPSWRLDTNFLRAASISLGSCMRHKSKPLLRRLIGSAWSSSNTLFHQGTPQEESPRRESVRKTQGSGLIISDHGGIVTNNHVVAGNLITSRCPPDLPASCRELFAAVKQAV